MNDELRVITHLERAVKIIDTERDPRKWQAMIDALPEAARPAVTLWLTHELKRRNGVKLLKTI